MSRLFEDAWNILLAPSVFQFLKPVCDPSSITPFQTPDEEC